VSSDRCGLVIRKGNMLCPDGELRVTDLRLAQGQIKEIGPDLQAEVEIDAAGNFVLPGLIDLHTHGIGVIDLQSDTGTLKDYAEFQAACGATTLYPTLAASPTEAARLLERHRRETNELRDVPQIAGFRLEFPYVVKAGAGAIQALRPITADSTKLMLDAGEGHIRIWDISPELSGAPELIQELSNQGIVCSISHTEATIEQARTAVDAGASLVTHLFDTFAVPEGTDAGVYPAGLVDYLLVEDRVTCEVIPDGTHVHPLLVEKAFRCKTPDRLAFVTDSAFGSGLPAGEYTEPSNSSRFVIRDRNEGRRDLATGDLSGSALTPLDAFRSAMEVFDKDIATASRVCSATPACVMGLNTGEIAVGRAADVIIIDSELELLCTIAAGNVIYDG